MSNDNYGASEILPRGRRWYLLGAAVTISALMALPAAGVFEGDIELLRLTASAQRDNMQRIATWEGSSCVEVSREGPEGVVMCETSAFHFIHSREHEATRWEWKGQSRYVREGLTVGGVPAAPNWTSNWANEMRKGDGFYVYGQNRTKSDGQKQNSLVIWPSAKASEGVHSYSFDPMWYLNGRATVDTDDLAGLLMFYYEKSADPSFAEGECLFRMNRDADLVNFEIRLEDVVNHYVFDLSKGGCVVKYNGESNTTKESHEWSYEQKDNVWIPKMLTTTFQKNVPSADGSTKVTRKITFTETALNRPVAGSEFSLAKLGLKLGDLVSDHRLGLLYRYGGAEDRPLDSVLGKDAPSVGIESSARSDETPQDGRATLEHRSPKDTNSEEPLAENTPRSGRARPWVYPAIGAMFALSLSLVCLLLLRGRWKKGVKS